MIGLDEGTSGHDPRWDRARALYAQVQAHFAAAVDESGRLLRDWPTYSPERRAEFRALFLQCVDQTPPELRPMWRDCPNLPAELRAELEARL